MLAALENIVEWVAETALSVFELFATTLSEMVEGFSKTAIQVCEEGPQILAAIPFHEMLIVASFVLIYAGLKKRLQARGVIIFLFGLGILLIGLSNLVIPDVLPGFLRV